MVTYKCFDMVWDCCSVCVLTGCMQSPQSKLTFPGVLQTGSLPRQEVGLTQQLHIVLDSLQRFSAPQLIQRSIRAAFF